MVNKKNYLFYLFKNVAMNLILAGTIFSENGAIHTFRKIKYPQTIVSLRYVCTHTQGLSDQIRHR